jgi:hypothetical protein
MAKRYKAPNAIVSKTGRGLSPVAAYDAELLMEAPMGREYDLVPRTKRSTPQNGTYWLMLKRVCAATGKWPSPRVLHHALKRACGYRFEYVDVETGEIREDVDSTAFDAMSHDDFIVYMQTAAGFLSEAVGFEVLAFLEDAPARRGAA